jgi:hypothetical protein
MGAILPAKSIVCVLSRGEVVAISGGEAGWLSSGMCHFLTIILSDLIGRLDLNEADKLNDRDPVSPERSNHWCGWRWRKVVFICLLIDKATAGVEGAFSNPNIYDVMSLGLYPALFDYQEVPIWNYRQDQCCGSSLPYINGAGEIGSRHGDSYSRIVLFGKFS